MDKFKDLPSKRFYQHFYPMLKRKEISRMEFAEIFETSISRPAQFWYDLKHGNKGITVKHILIAQKKFGLEPGKLFE